MAVTVTFLSQTQRGSFARLCALQTLLTSLAGFSIYHEESKGGTRTCGLASVAQSGPIAPGPSDSVLPAINKHLTQHPVCQPPALPSAAWRWGCGLNTGF